MPSIGVIHNRASWTKKVKALENKTKEILPDFLEEVSGDLVTSSPVDTGTYITEHKITAGGSVPQTISSHGKPRKQPWQPFADEGFSRLISQAEALPDDASLVTVSNASVHADKVEKVHSVYSRVRNRMNIHAEAAIAKFRARK